MKYLAIGLAVFVVVGSSLSCSIPTRLPDVKAPDIRVPTIQVGQVIEDTKSVPLPNEGSVDVNILFGAGDLSLSGGPDAGQLFTGDFRYNVAEWAPEVMFESGELRIKQGGDESSWGIPSSANMVNEWDLALAPGVGMDVKAIIGAGKGRLDLTGLQLTGLEINAGAGDIEVQCDAPNSAEAEGFTLRTGAARVVVGGIGNLSPAKMTVQGGAGDTDLDFTGGWRRSAEVGIMTGVGALTLRVPDGVGVRVTVEGLTAINNEGLRKDGDGYVNGAWGQSEVQLTIDVKAGVGSVRLIPVAE